MYFTGLRSWSGVHNFCKILSKFQHKVWDEILRYDPIYKNKAILRRDCLRKTCNQPSAIFILSQIFTSFLLNDTRLVHTYEKTKMNQLYCIYTSKISQFIMKSEGTIDVINFHRMYPTMHLMVYTLLNLIIYISIPRPRHTQSSNYLVRNRSRVEDWLILLCSYHWASWTR